MKSGLLRMKREDPDIGKLYLNQEESLKFYGLVVSSYGKVDS